MAEQDSYLADLMRAANRGDTHAYRRALDGIAPIVRGLARRGFARYGLGLEEVEDVVQETLLAVHLKRHMWDDSQPLLPWVRAIAQNKLVDNLRRRGRRLHVPIDDLSDVLAVDGEQAAMNAVDAERVLAGLKGRQRDVVLAVSVEGATTREVATRLGMTEGAVRVVLHRALKSLASAFRGDKQ